MDRICCIILNYNDAGTVASLVRELKGISSLTDILLVDNGSTDDSRRQLSSLTVPGRIHFLQNDKNGGYGAGNQAGINYALTHLNPDYLLIANPDIHITEHALLRAKEALAQTPDAAAASLKVTSPNGAPLFSYWTLLPMWKDLLDTGLVTRRLFKRFLTTSEANLPAGPVPQTRYVGAVPGSLFFVRTNRLPKALIHHLFDPEVFLYYEEKILGQKLKKHGLKTILVTDAAYVHAHSVTIDKTISHIAAKQKLLHKSKLYYYKNYLHARLIPLTLARLFLALVWAEVWFLTEICRMRW